MKRSRATSAPICAAILVRRSLGGTWCLPNSRPMTWDSGRGELERGPELGGYYFYVMAQRLEDDGLGFRTHMVDIGVATSRKVERWK